MPLTQNLKEAPMSILGLILPGRPDTQVIQVIHVPVGILGPVESCWIQEINRMLPTQRELFQELAGWIELSYHAGGKKPTATTHQRKKKHTTVSSRHRHNSGKTPTFTNPAKIWGWYPTWGCLLLELTIPTNASVIEDHHHQYGGWTTTKKMMMMMIIIIFYYYPQWWNKIQCYSTM